MLRPPEHVKVNQASKGRDCILWWAELRRWAGLSHAAPLHGGVQNVSVWSC